MLIAYKRFGMSIENSIISLSTIRHNKPKIYMHIAHERFGIISAKVGIISQKL